MSRVKPAPDKVRVAYCTTCGTPQIAMRVSEHTGTTCSVCPVGTLDAASGPVSTAFAKLVAYGYAVAQGSGTLRAAEELF